MVAGTEARAKVTGTATRDLQPRRQAATPRTMLIRLVGGERADLDEYMFYYNNERTNERRYFQGCTPLEAFEHGLALHQKFVFGTRAHETQVTLS